MEICTFTGQLNNPAVWHERYSQIPPYLSNLFMEESDHYIVNLNLFV